MFIVVAYDIEDDRRRARLHKTLKSFGAPVQYSVFECILDRNALERMKEAVKRIIDRKKDRVRYYYLCDGCKEKTEAIASKVVTRDPRRVIV